MSQLTNTIKGFLTRNQATILTYHSVLPEPFPFTIAQHINVSLFEKHMQHISRHYHCVPLESLVDQLEHNTIKSRTIAITFDDGFANNLHCALPILERYSLPATIFIPTGYIGQNGLLWPETLASFLAITARDHIAVNNQNYSTASALDKAAAYRAITRSFKSFTAQDIDSTIDMLLKEYGISRSDIAASPYYHNFRIMDWTELRAIAKSSLISIGSHTVNHLRLRTTDDEIAQSEIISSRGTLEKNFDNVNFFAYPFGNYGTDYSDKHIEMVKSSGYRAAVSSHSGMVAANSDHFQLPRTNIEATHTTEALGYILAGGPSLSGAAKNNDSRLRLITRGIFKGSIE